MSRHMPSRYLVLSDNVYADGDGNHLRLVLNTRTARVSALAPALSATLQNGQYDRLPPAVQDRLASLRLIVPAGTDELAEVVGEQHAKAAAQSSLYYVLVPTGYCNMGCEYCGQVHVKGKITGSHRDAVRNRVLRGIARPTTRDVEVGWYGGEPLMAYAIIRELSGHFIRAADDAGVSYRARMPTNGALLSMRKLRTLYHECRVDDICITVDGVGDLHDRHRPLKSGGGSYDLIVATLREAVSAADEFSGLHLTVRSNLDVKNVEQVDDFIDAMVEAGLNHPMINFDLHEVYSWSNDVSAIRLARREFAEQEPRWLDRMAREGMKTRLLPPPLREPICPAVTRSAEVISSTGALFSCTEHPLVPKHEAGDVLVQVELADPEQQRPAGRYDDWHDRIGRGEQGCAHCVFLPVCGGSCPKHWEEGDPPCPPYKLNIQQRLDIAAAQRGLTVVPRSDSCASS
jgi:uncharacterized protein